MVVGGKVSQEMFYISLYVYDHDPGGKGKNDDEVEREKCWSDVLNR